MIRMLLKFVTGAGIVAALAVGTMVLLERRPALRQRLTTRAETLAEHVASWFPGLRRQETIGVGVPARKVEGLFSSRHEQAAPAPRPDPLPEADISFINNSSFRIREAALKVDPPAPPPEPPPPPPTPPVLITAPEIAADGIPAVTSRASLQTERERLLQTLDRMRETRAVLSELR